jgi:hypothetical protein
MALNVETITIGTPRRAGHEVKLMRRPIGRHLDFIFRPSAASRHVIDIFPFRVDGELRCRVGVIEKFDACANVYCFGSAATVVKARIRILAFAHQQVAILLAAPSMLSDRILSKNG